MSALPEEQAAGRTYRLPTEAEWEYACRAGSTTRYSFGDGSTKLGSSASFTNTIEYAGPQPVGQKRPNAWGLYDMHGNVREWCMDGFAEYPEGLINDPTGPAEFQLGHYPTRVFRGGYAGSPAWECRSASRSGTDTYSRYTNLGFRVASLPSAGEADPSSPAGGDRTTKVKMPDASSRQGTPALPPRRPSPSPPTYRCPAVIAEIERLGGGGPLAKGWRASWSPEGRKIAFGQADSPADPKYPALGLMDVETGEPRIAAVGKDPHGRRAMGSTSPTSPAGTAGEELWLIEASGGTPRRLGKGRYPAGHRTARRFTSICGVRTS